MPDLAVEHQVEFRVALDLPAESLVDLQVLAARAEVAEETLTSTALLETVPSFRALPGKPDDLLLALADLVALRAALVALAVADRTLVAVPLDKQLVDALAMVAERPVERLSTSESSSTNSTSFKTKTTSNCPDSQMRVGAVGFWPMSRSQGPQVRQTK
jgi:hypothetical protein